MAEFFVRKPLNFFKKNMNNNKKSKAFTLTEVLITLVVLSAGIIALVQSYKQLVNALDATRNYQDSLCLLKNKMADIELMGIGGGKVGMSGNSTGQYSNFAWEINRLSQVENALDLVSVCVFNKKGKQNRKFSVLAYVEKTE
jgi:prepilin-type N-terminal cleavage/methylation domain-containing protein